MRINFFEEYPTDDNLEKARLIDFPSTIFLAAHSLKEFYQHKERLLHINPRLDVAYWPILHRSYWISPFSYTKDLKDFIEEMKTNKDDLTILIDLELPLVRNKSLYFRNLFSFFTNKKIIKQFFLEAYKYNISIVTAEYPPLHVFFLRLYRLLGISYDTAVYNHTSCVMYYTSMIPGKNIHKIITTTLVEIKKNFNSNLELGLGTIATGVLGNEPILSLENMARDLGFMKDNGFKTATIFRLGGLTQDYVKVIKNYTTSI